MTDNVAVLHGFTREITMHGDFHTLFLLVRPDVDFDDTFRAWDMDQQEWLNVNGWMYSDIEEVPPGCVSSAA